MDVDGLPDGLRAAGRDARCAFLLAREAAGLADDLLAVLVPAGPLAPSALPPLDVPLVLDAPLVLRAPDEADLDREEVLLGLAVPLARDAVGAGLTVDIAFAAAVSAFAAFDIDFVAAFIARMALDIVFAELFALVAAAVILPAADVTFVAAEDTVRAAVAVVAAVLADERLDRDAVAREVVPPDDPGALVRLDLDALREGAVERDALVVLELDVAAGRRAVPPDALRLTDPLRAVLVVLRRVAARVVV